MVIDQNILAETTKCKNDFECLKNEDYFCVTRKVEHCVNRAVYFTNCDINTSCNYKLIFGNDVVCHCPTRKEIFNKYNK